MRKITHSLKLYRFSLRNKQLDVTCLLHLISVIISPLYLIIIYLLNNVWIMEFSLLCTVILVELVTFDNFQKDLHQLQGHF